MPSIYPEFTAPLVLSNGFNGWLLSRHLDALDKIAADFGVTPLSSFVDSRTMVLQVLEEDELPPDCPLVCWYPPDEGIATVQGLLFCINLSGQGRAHDRLAVVAELEQLAALLKEARFQSGSFHLLVDL